MGRDIQDIVDALPASRKAKVDAGARRAWSAMVGQADSLESLRLRSGVSQKDLARLLGQPQSVIARMERGSDIRLSTLFRVAAALGWKLEVAVVAPDGQRHILAF